MMMVFFVEAFVLTFESIADGSNKVDAFYIGPICVIGSVLVDFLELLVAALQAYIFTFLTAMFLGLYAEPSH